MKNLMVRGCVYYVRAWVGKRLLFRSLGFRVGEPKAAERAAVEARKLLAEARAHNWERIAGIRLRDDCAPIGELVARYRENARLMGRPTARTVDCAAGRLLAVVEQATGRPAGPQPGSVLSGELVRRYVAWALRERGDSPETRRGIHDALRQARSVFARRSMGAFRGLRLPASLEEFRTEDAGARPPRDVEPFGEEEVRLLRGAGARLAAEAPRLWSAWALGHYAALRAGEIAAARRDWLELWPAERVEEYRRAGLISHVAGDWWRGGVWVLHCRGATKTDASKGYVPLHADVAAALLADLGGREWFVPGETPTARADSVRRDLCAWLRGAGWRRREVVQALRQYRIQVWSAQVGVHVAENWARHVIAGVRRHYVTALDLSAAPLGLAM